MNSRAGVKKAPFGLWLAAWIVILLYGQLLSQTPTTATIGGNIYTGLKDAATDTTVYYPDPRIQAVTNAKVMVQNQHSEGAFITYATVTGNSWTATVPAPGDYVVMFSAPGHDLTSREFTVEPGDNQTKDAYLPPLFQDVYGNPSPNELPLANLLVYSFYDNYVNGEDDAPDDPPLNGVTWTVTDEEGNVLATGVTGTQPTITLSDGTVITNTDGMYYFQGLPPGEVIATSDPSTAYHYDVNGDIAQLPVINPVTGQPFDFDATTEFYLDYTEEGGAAWDPKLYPGDPGAEGGGYLIWHGYVKKLGQIDATNVDDPERFGPGATLANAGSIHGFLEDADRPGLDPDEPFPVPGEDHPGVSLNLVVPDGLVILWTDDETVKPHPVATTEADPVTGEFRFDNIPPGRYKTMNFDIPLDYVWTQNQITVGPNQAVEMPTHSMLVPRFFARAQGFVYDMSDPNNPTPFSGAEVHIRYEDGSIQKEEITSDGTDGNPVGWYNFDDLPEIEVIGFVDVKLPPNYRGYMRTETFYPKGKPWEQPTQELADSALAAQFDKTFNAMNRYIQWLTANYRADLYIEPIPPTVGHISGFVFNDELERGTWTGDGVYNPDEERTLPDITVELWDATGTTLIASTTTGEFNEDSTKAEGWHEPYTWPPDELGGVFVGPLPGFYEFRDVAPGNYLVKVIPPAGFSPSPAASDVVPVTVTGGVRNDVNFGLNTLVPLAGEIEGGVFDDLNIDPRGGSETPDPNDTQSLLFMEKAGIPGVPVGIYDHLGYQLGAGFMGNPLCYAGAPLDPVTGLPQCPAGQDPIQKPEVERRAAPGVHLYVGNDPTLPGYCPNYLPLTLPYTFGQGKFKFEADWSLVPTA
ncbi:MAG: hypothetical protein D6814_07260, partial [Calditrichaeota bacterium]